MKMRINGIDGACRSTVKLSYRGHKECPERVIARPEEATGLLKWRIRVFKAWKVLCGEADAFKYSKLQDKYPPKD